MPVIGSGLIGQNLANTIPSSLSNTTFFASGVSNSASKISKAQSEREFSLLRESLNLSNRLVYFSTCSIADPSLASSPYVKHKLAVESFLSEYENVTTIRFPQVIGNPRNSYTLTSFLEDSIRGHKYFELWRYASRYIIDVNDALNVLYKLLLANTPLPKIIDVAPPRPIRVLDLVVIIEELLGEPANYSVIDCGDMPAVNCDFCLQVIPDFLSLFPLNYYSLILSKYIHK